MTAESNFVVIPGSRGSLSYLVKPIGDGESHARSLAHGAGRKWARSDARQRMRERFGMHQLVQTSLGGRVICEERDLLYEEAPAAYKNIEAVIQDLVAAGLVSVIATLRRTGRPVSTEMIASTVTWSWCGCQQSKSVTIATTA